MGKPMADACWCLVETNTILWSNYPSFKNLMEQNVNNDNHKLYNELVINFKL